MDAMNIEQLLTQSRAVMMDDEGYQVSAAASVWQPYFDAEVSPAKLRSGTIICYKCFGPNHNEKLYERMPGGDRLSIEVQLQKTEFLMQWN